ncbi:MAG: iron ABC transporter permease [Ilumatobacteraceae bacterium]|nr:iron ABC transporter permease [Ilumatobacteraceae bacterium]MDP4713260.1 iron ABC transporter permease [Ilumatobacteraceae bacterium]MDP4977056.1 iron ABC transporter permease [Ilumatobacteraceae bacterium]MDP5115242.1 iron ABC transporter permease [Ilumatobacteraceae bacterium]
MTAIRMTRPPLALVLPGLLAALTSIAPLAYLFDIASDRGLDFVWDEIWQQRTIELVARSLFLAASVSIVSVFISVPAAWLVTRGDIPFRSGWRVLLALPLAIPSYLAAFAWISWRPSLAGFTGAFVVLTLVTYPYVFLPVCAALSRLNPAIEEIAVIHGRGRSLQLILLAARQVRGSIATGALLVALYVLSDFGAVATMRYDAFTWVIYSSYRSGFNPSRAAILAIVLVLIALALLFGEKILRGQNESLLSARSVDANPRHRVSIKPVAIAFLSTIIVFALAFPIWRVVTWVYRYGSEDSMADIATALWHSVFFSGLAALATIQLALPIGILAGRYPSRSTTLLEQSTYVTHALPGIVIAISMVFLGVRLLEPIYLRTPLLVIAYVALFLPVAVGSIRSAAEQIPDSLDEVSRSLGLSQWGIVRRVTLPLLAPGLLSAGALVVLAGMKELPATMLLRPTGSETLATRLWTYTSVSDYAGAGPYALAIIVFVSIPTAIASRRL